MKKILFFALLLVSSTFLTAQHNYDNQSTIYSNEGRVSIGISTPYINSKLHVKSATALPWGIISESSSNDRIIGVGHDGTNGIIAVSHLGTDGFSPLQLHTNGSAQMTIESDGDIGIGKTVPLAKLHIEKSNGALLRLSNDANNYYYSGIDGLGAFFEHRSNTASKNKLRFQVRNISTNIYSQFYMNGENNSFNFMNGKVGIGTITPSEQLHVVNSSTPSKVVATSTGNPAGFFAERTDGAWAGLFAGLNGAALMIENGQSFSIAKALATETPYSSSYFGEALLTVKPDGNVGIGTTTPTAKLSIMGGGLNIASDANNSVGIGVDALGSYMQPVSNVASTNKLRLQVRNLTTNIYSQLYANGENSSFNFINGNVGIGSTKPAGLLHVKGANEQLILHAPADGWAFAIKVDADNINFNRALIASASPSNYIAQSATLMSFDKANDNVGIGTTTPAHKLDVNGTINATNILINGQAIPQTNSPDWPANPATYVHFGSTTLDQTDNKNYCLLQQKIVGTTYLNSPDIIVFRIKDNQKMILDANGNLGIGTFTPQAKLAVAGKIRATEVKVMTDVNVPDYVFADDYQLRTLKETQAFIAKNHHLPEIPSAAEIGEDGFNLGEMDMSLLKKIEELTLYQIELMEKMEAQAEELQKVKQELKELKK